MSKKLEICVDSYESAWNAWLGGADRLEVCRDLSVGGLTPSAGFVASVKTMESPHRETGSPISVLIRPHARNFFYNSYEIKEMEEDVKIMRAIGVNGLVFGAQDMYGNVNKDICRRLLSAANGIPCTFHRAFDIIKDKEKALEDLIDLGFARVLTSGCKTEAKYGVNMLTELIKQAKGRIIVMPGGNVNVQNIFDILNETEAVEIHSSGRETDSRGVKSGKNLCCPRTVKSMKDSLKIFK